MKKDKKYEFLNFSKSECFFDKKQMCPSTKQPRPSTHLTDFADVLHTFAHGNNITTNTLRKVSETLQNRFYAQFIRTIFFYLLQFRTYQSLAGFLHIRLTNFSRK